MPGVAETGSSEKEDNLTPTARENIEALAENQEEEEAEISRTQGVIEAVSDVFGSPAFFFFVVVFSVAWVAINSCTTAPMPTQLRGSHAGWKHVDAPPFSRLQGSVSFSALLLTVAVLIRQNRMSKLAARRAYLDLHLNLPTEKKVSKVLEELDELRAALGHARPDDREANHLATVADPKAILGAIKQSENDAAATSC